MRALGRRQRTFLNHVRYTLDRYPNSPCFVPKCLDATVDIYLKMIEGLEKAGYIEVNRNGETYRQWIVTIPKVTFK